MSTQTPLLDPIPLRAQFPALNLEVNGQTAVFLDGPGGTQSPQSVIDTMGGYLAFGSSNSGGPFITSRHADAITQQAQEAMADLLQDAFVKTAIDLVDQVEKEEAGLPQLLTAILDGQHTRTVDKSVTESENGVPIMTVALLNNIISGLINGPNLPYAREYWHNTNTPQRRAERLAGLEKVG